MSIEFTDKNIPFINLGDGYEIRLEYENITEEKYLERAKNELRESPETVEVGIKELRELIKNEKDFQYPHEHDPFLMTFLRPSKFYAQSAFDRMQKYFKFKLKHKKHCEDLTVESTRVVFEDDLVKYLPLRDVEGRRILHLDCGKKWNPSRCSTYDIFRAIQLSLQAAMAEPLTQVNGVVVILDFDGLSLSQIVHFTPVYAAMVLDWIQNCIPIRLKGIYIVNNSYIFNMLYAVFKPFIGSKLRKRIQFLNKDWKSLTSKIGAHALRPEFGGNCAAPYVDGKLLVEFMKLFDKQFELMALGGYNIQMDEEKQQKLDEGIKEVLNYLS